MKKLICVLLSFVLLYSVSAPAAASAAKAEVYPTIIVAGYSSSDLFLNGEHIWKPDLSGLLKLVLSKIAQIGRGLGELAFQRPEYLVNLLGGEVYNMAGKMACNPDGSSVYNITTYNQDAKHTQFSYLYNEMNGQYVHEAAIMADIAKEYGANGNDHLFCYQQDFRMSMTDCAKTLDKYIDSVLKFTKASKVNIISVSHGGQTVAAYLAMYGMKKNVVNNLLMIVPAIGGAALAYDVMSEQVALDEETLLYFIENGNMLEEDINWLVRAHQFGVLDQICNLLIHNYIKKILGYWGSMWDFIPTEYYEELKAQMLDPVESKELIRKSDYFHYKILANITETFSKCEKKGMNLYILAGAGMPSVTGLQEQSDAIITVNAATGAKTAPYGYRFNNGYRQLGAVCKNKQHNHLSPDMAIDLSCGYLPDSTWIVNGMFHGMSWKDEYCAALCKKLLFAKSRINVHTYKEYPQFKYSTNTNYSVIAAFDRSVEGYWSKNDTALVITNLSKKYRMRIVSVGVEGAIVTFDLKKPVWLAPQASCTVPLKGALQEESLTTADITVNYSLLGSATPIGSRTQVFTVMNGPAPAYDLNTPFVPSLHKTAFDQGVSETAQKILRFTGVFDFLKMIVNSMLAVMRSLTLK